MTRNQCSGRAVRRAVASARVIAMIFGTCSPIEMWSAVTNVNARATEIPVATPCPTGPSITGSISCATAGSPRNPIPIEAMVIPTWAAERYSSSRSIWPRTASALRSPSLAMRLDLPPPRPDQGELGRDE